MTHPRSHAWLGGMVVAFGIFGALPLDNNMIECPYSHTHVWHIEQCPQRNTGPFPTFGGGGGGGAGGLLGVIGRALGL